jgi:outer membrane biosynthesis protein TonB
MRTERIVFMASTVLVVCVFCQTIIEAKPMHKVTVSVIESECSSNVLKKYVRYLEREITKSWAPAKSVPTQIGITFFVHAGGELSDLRLTDSSKQALTDQAALKAVERQVFTEAPPKCGNTIKFKAVFN